MLPTRDMLQTQKYKQVESKIQQKICNANSNHKKQQEKRDFKTRNISRDKEASCDDKTVNKSERYSNYKFI